MATRRPEEKKRRVALLAERLHTTSSVDLNLVSKRMFLDWLSAELVRERAAA